MTQDRHTETVRIYDGDGQPINAGNPLPVTGGAGGTSMTDDAAFTPGSSSVTPIGAFADETGPDDVDEGDIGAVRMTLKRGLHVNLRDSSGNEVSVGGGTQYTEGDTDATITGTAMLMEGAADTLVPAQGTVSDGLLVNLGGNNDVVAGGNVASGAADSGNPVKVGGVGKNAPTAVDDGDRTNIWTNRLGAVVISADGPGNAGSDTVMNITHPSLRGATSAGSANVLASGAYMYDGSTNWVRQRGDATNGLDVDVTRSALPTGASTLAEQQSQTTALSAIQTDAAAIEVLLAAIDADTDAIKTAVQLLDNAISGNEMQVDIVAPLPSGTNLLGITSVGFNTDAIYQGATSRTVGFGVIDAASSGDNTLLAAQGASNKIRVHSLFLIAAGAVNVRFESGAGGTALTGQMNLVANTGFVLPFNPLGWFETAANTLLNLELSGAVSVDGSFQYSVVQ